MAMENNELPLNLQEVNKTTGEVVKLDVNSASTVQPVALMRLGLFVPTLKSTSRSKTNRKTSRMRLRSSYSCPLPGVKGIPMSGSPDRASIWIRTSKSGLESSVQCMILALRMTRSSCLLLSLLKCVALTPGALTRKCVTG